MTPWHLEALATAAPVPFWLDRPERPTATPPLAGAAEADLLIVGGGFTGLWAAIRPRRTTRPRRRGARGRPVGWGASGRNGGFLSASLTHGLANGRSRFPDEIDSSTGSASRTSPASRQPRPLRHRRSLEAPAS